MLRLDSHSSPRRCSVTNARMITPQAHAASSNRPAQVKPGPRRSAGCGAAGRGRSSVRGRRRRSARSYCRGRAAPRARGRAGSSASAVSIASITLAPPGCEQRRSMSRVRPKLASIESTAGEVGFEEQRDRAVEDYRQPGILDTPAHDAERRWPQMLARPSIVAMPSSPARTTAAAAPSPNKAVATIAAGSSLSRRIEIEQVSTVTNSQRVPGSAAARRAAVARPDTPPAHPSPKIGTRRTSGRSPSEARPRASRLGVAIPVVVTVTIPSISPG